MLILNVRRLAEKTLGVTSGVTNAGFSNAPAKVNIARGSELLLECSRTQACQACAASLLELQGHTGATFDVAPA
jgi:hypothetical protein